MGYYSMIFMNLPYSIFFQMMNGNQYGDVLLVKNEEVYKRRDPCCFPESCNCSSFSTRGLIHITYQDPTDRTIKHYNLEINIRNFNFFGTNEILIYLSILDFFSQTIHEKRNLCWSFIIFTDLASHVFWPNDKWRRGWRCSEIGESPDAQEAIPFLLFQELATVLFQTRTLIYIKNQHPTVRII